MSKKYNSKEKFLPDSWKSHIDMLASKLNKAYFIARTIRPFLSLNSLMIIYHAYFHSVITYGLIANIKNLACDVESFKKIIKKLFA
jgi:hypothetical protein